MEAIEQTCPRCRDRAWWSYSDDRDGVVDVNCKKCGTFQMSGQDVKEALAEMETEDNETRTPG